MILLNDIKPTRFNDLKPDTENYFEKIAGYDTLRLILCKKAILVEGDSDELVLQKAYMLKNSGKLPIEDEIDVISVGTSFLRFLEIAEKIKKPVVVITDNDGDIEAVHKKYVNYLGNKAKTHIQICFDKTVDTGSLMLGSKPAIQFRQWAINILRDFAIRGFVLDKERLKNGSFFNKEYFDHLLAEIREIRASERRFYQKITDIYATAVDYNVESEITKTFFAAVQNKLHFAIHGNTAAELIMERANSNNRKSV